jgi:polar amino acid transport system permease protein
LADQRDTSDDVVAVPLRHPWRWIAVGLATAFLLSFIWAVFSAPSIQHDLVAKFLFDRRILIGMLVTIGVTVLCMFIATILAALQSLIDDGQYATLLATWNMSANGVQSASINGTK